MVQILQVCSKDFTSKTRVFGSKKCARLTDARLHAVLSRNMYSEHGLEALMRPPSGHVCHSLMVLSYCTPGSAQAQAAKAISSHSFCADILFTVLPFIRPFSSQSLPSLSA